MMVFSLVMSNHTPSKEPAFCRVAKKPALKRNSTSEGRLSMSKRYERTELQCIDHLLFLSALIFRIIVLHVAASRNMFKNLNVGDTLHPHSRNLTTVIINVCINKSLGLPLATQKELQVRIIGLDL